MIRTVILDDDANSRRAAREALSDFEDVKICGEFSGGMELFSFPELSDCDLLFLDIELADEMGFDVASRLKAEAPELLIVFLTGHSSYAIDGYDFQPVNFLTKPINMMKLENTIEEVRRRLRQKSGKQEAARIMFRLPQGYRLVDVRDVCYVERVERKNLLMLPEEPVRIAGYTMSELEEMLAPHGFFMCHQSFIVSLYRIEAVRNIGKQLYEADVRGAEKPVPVSRNKYDQLMKKLREIPVVSL